MCILFIAVKQHPNYPLIIAANRDEFFARPTQTSEFWPPQQQILAGKDLQAGGSWMGINRNGFLAALTNIRDPKAIATDRKSRGQLVLNYLQAPDSDYLQHLQSSRQQFNGYNLVFGHWHSLQVYNNADNSSHLLSPGTYGLSNANLTTPWPKVTKGIEALSQYCHQPTIEPEQLFALLKDQQQADDHQLPDTGIPYEWEKRLSAIFIRGEDYGTRSSTLLLIDKYGNASWFEKTFIPGGVYSHQVQYQLSL